MIERSIVDEQLKQFRIQEFITQTLRNVGHSHVKLQKTPLGDKIIIYAARPGLIVGRKGANIAMLTDKLKSEFELDNPQIEINEVENVNLDARIVAEQIANSLEKFGSQRFKGIGHKVLSGAIRAGALGVELVISGKIPSSRARSWRFYQGYLKKCGDIALTGVRTAYASARLKTGTVGIRVKIMPPETKLPDNIKILDQPIEMVEEVDTDVSVEMKETKPVEKKQVKKKTSKKKTSKKKESDKSPAKEKSQEEPDSDKDNSETNPEAVKVKESDEKEEK